MKERPILFSGPMVKALLSGAKTQTRRLMKPQPFSNGMRYSRDLGDIVCHCDYLPPSAMLLDVGRGKNRFTTSDVEEGEEGLARHCPYGVPGDRLWVRETWASSRVHDTTRPSGLPMAAGEAPTTWYASDGTAEESWLNRGRWRPSIHMPRWASRITLEVTYVRVQRLQDISEEDAQAEGLSWVPPTYGLMGDADSWRSTAREAFAVLWESINGKRAPWATNPWVFAISFKRVTL